MSTPPVDLSDMPQTSVVQALGELVQLLLTRGPAAVLLLHPDGTHVTTLSPALLQHVPPEVWAAELVEVWDEEAIVSFLGQLYGQ